MSPLISSPALVEQIQQSHLRHVAIVMDGNRRWAKQRHLPTLMGHKKGVDTLRTLVRFVSDHGLEALTVYAFSTENWRRSQEEVGYLMGLFMEALSRELDDLHRNQVIIRFIGDLAGLPSNLREIIEIAHQKTGNNTGLKLQIATNYGGRQEIIQVMQRLGEQIQAGTLNPADINESLVEEYLYTVGLPQLDLLIRTGGDARISNYLIWQSSYAEFYVTDTLWPDFSPEAFEQAVATFAASERRFGK